MSPVGGITGSNAVGQLEVGAEGIDGPLFAGIVERIVTAQVEFCLIVGFQDEGIENAAECHGISLYIVNLVTDGDALEYRVCYVITTILSFHNIGLSGLDRRNFFEVECQGARLAVERCRAKRLDGGTFERCTREVIHTERQAECVP